MKSTLFAILILITTQFANAQTKVTINKNKKNAALFDDSSPNSLFGMMKSSYENLGYFDVEGMDESLVNSLSAIERSKLIASTTNDVYPMHDEFGSDMVYIDSITGDIEMMYSYPDTVYTSLDNIERMVLNVEDGNGLKFDRINTVEFWKKYDGELHRVMTISSEILDLKGFRYIESVEEEIQEVWLNRADSSSLWNQMKISALETFERNRVMDGGNENKDFSMAFFPTIYDFVFYYFVVSFPSEIGKNPEETSYLQARNFLKMDYMPFQFSYGDGLVADSNNRLTIEGNFDSVNSHWHYYSEPLYEMDPDAYNFGEPIVIQTEEGILEYVYEDPELFYIWLDYQDIQLFAVKQFNLEENDSGMLSKIIGLVFTQKSQTGKPEIVSYMPIEGLFKSYFESYPITQLRELPWYKVLRKEAKRKRNTKQDKGFYLSIG